MLLVVRLTRRLLKELALKVYGEDLARKVWGRIEIIGDIAVIRKPFDLEVETLKPLADEILRSLPYVKSVWAAITPVKGEYRVRNYVHLAGEERSTTLYREHGCVFKVDIKETYVSPVLNYEHLRIASQVRDGEFVINMFAGVGLFSIIMARKANPSKVISIDINPRAYELMVENVRLNKVEDTVIPVLGDAGKVVAEQYVGTADRVLMPLPLLVHEYLPIAVKALRSEGFIHVYEFTRAMSREEAVRIVEESFLDELRRLGVEAEAVNGRVVRSAGPRRYQVVVDLKIYRTSSSS